LQAQQQDRDGGRAWDQPAGEPERQDLTRRNVPVGKGLADVVA